jgi:hypothetical protein
MDMSRACTDLLKIQSQPPPPTTTTPLPPLALGVRADS